MSIKNGDSLRIRPGFECESGKEEMSRCESRSGFIQSKDNIANRRNSSSGLDVISLYNL
jgi:hypothetical protein